MRTITPPRERKRLILKFFTLYTPTCSNPITLATPYTDDPEEYDDYNNDGDTPIDEEPEYDTDDEEEDVLYLLYRDTILKKIN